MYVLANARVFNGVDPDLSGNTDIVIKDGIIADILPSGSQNLTDLRTIDLGGDVVTPGFIDGHVHMLVDRRMTNDEHQLLDQTAGGVGLENADFYTAYRGADSARRTIEAGFTTVVDLGGSNFGDVALREAINQGFVVGPHYNIVGKQLTAWASHFKGMGMVCAGADGMRKAVRSLLYWGVDHVKIENCAPMRSIGRSMEFPAFTDEELQAATDEAHKAGLLVSAHARSAESILSALRNGVDIITHGTGIDDRCIELMIEQGKYLQPTLASPSAEIPEGAQSQNTERFWELWKAQGRVQWESIKHAYESGVKIAFATDAGAFGNLNGENVNEFFRMRELGMSALECLRAATSEAAKSQRIDDRTGRVEVGLDADLIVLPGNPLESLDHLRNVKAVIKSGRIVKQPAGWGL